ncbi:MAG: hypothetical protein RIB84_14820 [Sneathiellaceae bacterium]
MADNAGGTGPGSGAGIRAAPPFNLDLIFGLAFQAIRGGLGGFVLLLLWSFVLLAVITGILIGSWIALSEPGAVASDIARVDPAYAAIVVAMGLLYLVGIALIHLTTVGLAFAVLRHRRVPLSRLFALSRRRFWPALGSMVLAMLGTGLGLLLFIVPGLILLVRWWVWAPASLIEGCGPGRALGRSAELTRGVRWMVFWTWLITFLVSGALNQVAAALADWHFAFGVLSLAIYGFASVFWSCLMVAVYVALRDREGGAAPDLVGDAL